MSELPSALVTGATGFLGANIGAFLAGRANRVATTRAGRAVPHYDEFVDSDLLDPTSLATFIRQRRPNVVIHSAAIAHHAVCESDPALAHAVNVEATVRLAQAAQEVGAGFVFVSSDAVFDGAHGGYSEEDPVSPTSAYGRSKAEAEARISQMGSPLIIRTNFFGWSPTGERSILEFFVNNLSAGRKVRGFTDFTTSSAYAQELAHVVWDLVELGASGTFHVTSPDRATKYDFGVAVAEEFGLDAGLIEPSTADIHPPRLGDISLNVDKVQSVLGRRLPTIRTGIARARDDSALRARLLLPDAE